MAGRAAIYVLVASLAVFHSASSQVRSTELSPGVVLDTNTRQVFLMSQAGGVLAVDARSGRQLWHSDAASKPLAVHNSFVIGQADVPTLANRLKVVALDAAHGGRLLFERSAPLPAGVSGSIAETREHSLAVHAASSDNKTTISWQFRLNAPMRGAPLRGSDAIFGASPWSSTPPRTPPAPVAPNVRGGAFQIDWSTRELSFGASPNAVPTAPSATIKGLAPAQTNQYVSVDGDYLLRTEAIKDAPSEEFQWTIYRRDSSAEVGQMKSDVRTAPFTVLGDLLVCVIGPYGRLSEHGFFEQGRQVRGVSLTTGKVIWRQLLRDTAVRGSLPP